MAQDNRLKRHVFHPHLHQHPITFGFLPLRHDPLDSPEDSMLRDHRPRSPRPYGLAHAAQNRTSIPWIQLGISGRPRPTRSEKSRRGCFASDSHRWLEMAMRNGTPLYGGRRDVARRSGATGGHVQHLRRWPHSDHDTLDLVDRHRVRHPVVELRCLRRRVRGDLLGVLEGPPVPGTCGSTSTAGVPPPTPPGA